MVFQLKLDARPKLSKKEVRSETVGRNVFLEITKQGLGVGLYCVLNSGTTTL